MSENTEYKGYTIRIEQDEDISESPRDWDNLGTMVCFHRDYTLGDILKPKKQSYCMRELQYGKEPNLFSDVDEYKEWLEEHKKDIAVILPLYLLDHSGLWISTGHFNCDPGGWDTSYIGHIFVTKEQVREEYSKKLVTKKLKEQAEKVLRSEVEVYNQFLSGDVWGYIIEKDGEELDSLWGCYGSDYCLSEAKAVVDHLVKKEEEQAWTKVNMLPLEA